MLALPRLLPCPPGRRRVGERMVRIAVAIGQYPAEEKERRVKAILKYNGGGIEVGTIDVEASPYSHGFDGTQAVDAIPAFIATFKRAEAAGYDAVVPLGVLDIAVEEGQEAVGIPVVGSLFASLCIGRAVGARLGLIAYSENLIPDIAALAKRYDAESFVAGYGHVATDLTRLNDQRHTLRDKFCEAARALMSQSRVDVIVSAGISLVPLHLDRADLAADLGVPVVEPIGAPIHLAAALASLRPRGAR